MVRRIQVSDEGKGGCRGPRTYQDITLFDSWLSNAFIYGLALLALVASLPLIPNAQTMMDAAGGSSQIFPEVISACRGPSLPTCSSAAPWKMPDEPRITSNLSR